MLHFKKLKKYTQTDLAENSSTFIDTVKKWKQASWMNSMNNLDIYANGYKAGVLALEAKRCLSWTSSKLHALVKF